jgi:hypothetical protein
MNLYTHMADMLVDMDQRRLAADPRIGARMEAARWLRRRKRPSDSAPPSGRSGPSARPRPTPAGA